MVRQRNFSNIVFNIVSTVFMMLFFIIIAYPFLYVVNCSLSDGSISGGSLLLLPKGLTLDSYTTLLKDRAVTHAFFISVLRSFIGPSLQLIITGMAAYAIASPNLVFPKILRLIFILPMYLSAGIIPNYVFMKMYGLTNNFLVYILPNICSSYNMILIMTYIKSIPGELTEAVYIDGGNDFQAYWRVIFPVCMPVNAAVFLFGVITQWNSLMDTEIYCAMTEKLHTLQYVLFSTLASKTNIESLRSGMITVSSQSLKMAITVITILPVLCVYPALQRYFVSGIMLGSVKA